MMRRLLLIIPISIVVGCVNPPPRYYLSVGECDLATNAKGCFGFPSGIAITDRGEIYVTDTFKNRIAYFSADGSLLGAWGATGTGDGEFRSPKGLAVSPKGYVYVADNYNYRIQYFTHDGSFVGKWGSYGPGDGELYGPIGIGVAEDGNVYVTDSCLSFAYITSGGSSDYPDNKNKAEQSSNRGSSNRNGCDIDEESFENENPPVDGYEENAPKYRVQYFTSNGSFLGKWETAGSAEGESLIPYGIALAPNGDVYVTDISLPGVRYFTPTGSLKGSWGRKGRGEGEFEDIDGIAVGPDGLVYVTDNKLSRIQYFTRAGSFIGQWRIEGIDPDLPARPNAVALSPNGFVYVSDYAYNIIRYFRPVR
jgi:sugar lactone lactonase YvrE